jgi:hypothetical protein
LWYKALQFFISRHMKQVYNSDDRSHGCHLCKWAGNVWFPIANLWLIIKMTRDQQRHAVLRCQDNPGLVFSEKAYPSMKLLRKP